MHSNLSCIQPLSLLCLLVLSAGFSYSLALSCYKEERKCRAEGRLRSCALRLHCWQSSGSIMEWKWQFLSAAGQVGKWSLLLECILVLLRYTAMGKEQVLRWERTCAEFCWQGCRDYLWKV